MYNTDWRRVRGRGVRRILWTEKEKLQSKPTASSEPQGREGRGDPSEFARKKHPYEKGSRECEARRFNL